ncbi:MAG: hypothetical protein RLY70_4419 [Planctomycetota bacterium]
MPATTATRPQPLSWVSLGTGVVRAFLAVFAAVVTLLDPLGFRHDAVSAEPIKFARDILPILSDHCFHCHGQDEKTRAAGLRLDTAAGALRETDRVIVPGQSAASELARRLVSTDPDEMMPPPSAKRRPTAAQIALLRRWIDEGAAWGKHWAFEPIERPTPPTVRDTTWPRHPIDHFVLRELENRGWRPSPEASPATLARRLHLDLLGLPPHPESFAARSTAAESQHDADYPAIVDRVLASPHLGERLAWFWLDASRYSDTDGYQGDETRTNWPWRDWVIESLGRGMPFDQFTREQFAGDLLPNATADQELATCFHRNHMTNGEGGRDPEESRIDYVIDRVNTTGAVWLGLTLGCCQCHSHKYDPITQVEYYQLAAFFNSIDETGAAGRNAKPYLAYSSPRTPRAVAAAQSWLAQRESDREAARKAAEPAFEHWLSAQIAAAGPEFATWIPFIGEQRSASAGSQLETLPDRSLRADGPDPFHEDYRVMGRPGTLANARTATPTAVSTGNTAEPTSPTPRLQRITGLKLEVFPDAARPKAGLSRAESGHFILTDIKVQIRRPGGSQAREAMPVGAIASYAAEPGKNGGYGDIRHTLDDDPRNGWATFGAEPDKPQFAVFAFAEPIVLADDEELVLELQHRSTRGHANIGRFRWSLTDQPGSAVRSLDPSPLEQLSTAAPRSVADVDTKLRSRLFDQFLADEPRYQRADRAAQRAATQLADAKKAEKVDVMVLSERAEPRPTHLLVRGQWDKKGELVVRGVPAALHPWPASAATSATSATTATTATATAATAATPSAATAIASSTNMASAVANRSRLELADWLTARENPLTARVLANHIWQLLFGEGLVRTPEDFGLQGERPSHPELLDWLASDLLDSGWDVHRLIRSIVTSATYRQSSDMGRYPTAPAATTAGADPRVEDSENRWLWRGARYRLPSWMIRDSALQAAGLLNPAIGGPPVRPHQPASVWEEMFMGRFKYEPTEGGEQYRRSIYAFWRRSSSPAFLFDSAQRRVCELRTPRTNTPLQALTLLNDLTYLEASRELAWRTLTATGESSRLARLTSLWRRVLGRLPTADEQAVIEREWLRAHSHYNASPDEARRWLSHGQGTVDPAKQSDATTAEWAAYAVVASMVFNLDEAITRQ